jgi:polyphenol oxidase
MNRLSVSESAAGNVDRRFITLPFYHSGILLEGDAPRWGMTLRCAESMRFRWSETNDTRMRTLKEISERRKSQKLIPVQLELIHSKTVYAVSSFSDTFGLTGDGIITLNKNLMPVITVADCMPLFLYDPVTGVFGAVHSGWKGTGIIGEAVSLAGKEFGTEAKNVCVAIGPHIRNCCYIVDEERALYFRRTFCDDCVTAYEPGSGGRPEEHWNTNGGKLYRLSLEKANLAVLAGIGVRDENISVADDCTCCNKIFGSFRRESSGIAESDKWRSFTVQAAFCGSF